MPEVKGARRVKWTIEDYGHAIESLRRHAARLRKDANNADAKADALRKECAEKSTEKLPLFPPLP